MPTHSARSVALSVLIESERSRDGLNVLVNRVLTRTPLDGRDRALAVEITHGVWRRLGTIDWRLEPIVNKPLPRLPIIVQMLLRMSAYQLLFLDKIPPSAAVNESVKLAKAHKRQLKRDWSGFVNAVLRALIREAAPPWPSINDDAAYALSVRYAVPKWLSRRWLDRLGVSGAEAACEDASHTPPLTIRVNRLKIGRNDLLRCWHEAGVKAKATRVSPAGITLEEGVSISSLPGFAEGQFYVEDEAAQLVPLLVDAHPGDHVLDACAAPGGKATHLAELMRDDGRIYAVDRHAARLAVMQDNLRRLQLQSIVPLVGDLTHASWKEVLQRTEQPSDHGMDRILVDAPCSGLGVLRRHPEAKWRKDPQSFRRHHAAQFHILESVAPCLRPGGVLVYSTCSTEPEETEAVIDRFLQSHTEFRRESVAPWLPEPARQFVTRHGDLSTTGNRDSMDGFYAARLTKHRHD
jgi:16S rRNA (cytosine967-C5)-methyltransferase